MHFSSAPAMVPGLLAQGFAGWRSLSPREAVALSLQRMQAHGADPAWIYRATEQQVADQWAAIERRDAATLPLLGLPFAVKDNIDVAGWPTTAACPAFAYTATHTAQAVQKLMDAGAVLVGKTNLDQFATGLVGTRSPYGAVPNTFDDTYISGGSSSGSASVVARGLVAFALGTDTAGSGRVPAGFNNLVGMKPTPGRVSMRGVLPACRTLDCLSTLTLLAGDAAQVLAVMEHAPGQELAEPQFNPCTPGPASFGDRPRVAAAAQPEFFGDAAYQNAFGKACAHLATLLPADGRPGSVDMAPFFEVARLLYDGPWVAERYCVVGPLLSGDPNALNPVVREVIGKANRFSAADAFAAQYRLRELQVQTQAIWQHFDMLMVPTAPTLPTQAAVAAQPVLRNSELGLYTNFVNLLGLAAVAVPASFTPNGLPFGVTFIGPGGSDAALLHWAQQWQRSLNLPLGCHLVSGSSGGPVAPEAARPSLATPLLPRSQPTLALAVVGAHLQGMPLHDQLRSRDARLRERTRTAPCYSLHELAGQSPPKPGLQRLAHGGHAVEVEVYEMPLQHLGSFLALIAPPLGLGSIELANGQWVKGFICEPHALIGAADISAHGGWRAYLAQKNPQAAAPDQP